MPFKYDEQGNLVTQEVNGRKLPVFAHADGREAPFDADTTVANISRLNGEAKAHREAKEAAEAKLRAFDGIEDGEAARKALETIKNLGAGELKTAAQVQEIKDAAAKSAQEAVAAATRAAQEKERQLLEQNTKLTQDLNNHIIGGSFASSKFIAEKLAIPADIAQKVFGDRFKVENGKLMPLDASGNPIFSATRHGEHADFDEAIAVMVGQYANKDMILKGSGASGGGAAQSGKPGGGKEVSRSQFDAMGADERMSFAKSGGKVTD